MPAIRVSDGLESCQTVDLLAMKTTIAGNNAPKLRAYSAILITFAIIFAWMPDTAAQTVNLNITKVANPTTAVPGQTVSWTITLQSTTPLNAQYRLSDTFPNGFIFNQGASTIPAGTFSYNSGTNSIIHDGTVPGNGTHQFVFVGTVNPGFNAPGTLNNTATMNYTAPGITLPDEQASASIAVIRTSISGFKYNDQNGNGSFNAGEPRLPGWTIYIDANNNNQLDSGEVDALTDANGDAYFLGMTAGTYRIREVLEQGWSLVLPSVAGKQPSHQVDSTLSAFQQRA